MILDRPLIEHPREVEPEYLVGDLIQPGHPLFGVIWINRERLSGAPAFFGTRVFVKTLFDYLESGSTIAEFLDDFEGVLPEQVEAVLKLARMSLLSELPRLEDSF